VSFIGGAPAPMRVLAIGIELTHGGTVQCPHDADAREHRWAVMFDDQEHRLDRGLSLLELLFGLGQLLDIPGSFLEGDELAAAAAGAAGGANGGMSRTFTFERSLIRRTYGPPPPPSPPPPPNCDEPVPLKLEPPGYSDEDLYG
jgi:hypothetical protein